MIERGRAWRGKHKEERVVIRVNSRQNANNGFMKSKPPIKISKSIVQPFEHFIMTLPKRASPSESRANKTQVNEIAFINPRGKFSILGQVNWNPPSSHGRY